MLHPPAKLFPWPIQENVSGNDLAPCTAHAGGTGFLWSPLSCQPMASSLLVLVQLMRPDADELMQGTWKVHRHEDFRTWMVSLPVSFACCGNGQAPPNYLTLCCPLFFSSSCNPSNQGRIVRRVTPMALAIDPCNNIRSCYSDITSLAKGWKSPYSLACARCEGLDSNTAKTYIPYVRRNNKDDQHNKPERSLVSR